MTYVFGQLIIPADLNPQTASCVRDIAKRAFLAVDASGLARVDFFIADDEETVMVNEINTLPGFTEISMYPKLWESSGVNYSELIDRLIQLAMERHKDRLESTTKRWLPYVWRRVGSVISYRFYFLSSELSSAQMGW